MNKLQKQQIADRLQEYCDRFGSQNQASNTLKNVSSATVNQILNRKWELISDEMFRSVGAQIGWLSDTSWNTVDTRDMKMMQHLLKDAQENSLVFAITGDAGTGKTHALRTYVNEHKGAYLLQCNEFWNRKYFLQEMLNAIGRDSSGYTTGEMMQEIVMALKKREHPLIILDEADKLSDQVLYFFITLYNNLEDHCGIIMIATDHLAKRIKRGRKLNKKGYNEIYSRIGRKFIELNGLSSSDIAAVCVANGIEDPRVVKEVIEDSEMDLRRIKRKIHALKNAA
jgi:Cdc6-like AAA superfamily ATPase